MKTVLLIEDNLQIRENTLEILELAGYNTYEAEDGIIGFNIARERFPDLILCDIMMPGMTGYEVLKAIRMDDKTKFIPLIFVTASTEKKEIQFAFDLGANGYVRKPFDTQELLSAIKDCINGISK